MGSLRRLSLYSNLYWGFYPKFSLEGIHFPNLQSLALGNFTFFEDKQLDWILSHSSTLEEIYLDDCPIIFDVRMLDYQLSECPIPASEMQYVLEENGCDGWRYYYPRRWSDYFASFEAGLPHLRHFATGHSEAWDFEPGMPFEHEKDLVPVLTEARYIQFNGGLGPSQFITPSGCYNKEWPVCDDEDREAFKSLLRKIDQQVNCGEFTIGNLEVENLVELHY
ncbi:hypothetical protein N7457_005528 [Penicillium paradoxum]|uniref:uncharacterized protein n=1 Tax=Penicillium paradoxum TaxID=176176 RepID=UPI00254970CA|nr:uncharacterized protein N7457_005528 [Penicillium paradoxum]KAJ5780368.1 hypothetical protein N7457_005528 [Penicillium paradoxum]